MSSQVSATSRVTTPGRPIVGIVLGVIAVIHIATAYVFYGDSLRSIVDAGVVASIDKDPALNNLRSAGFWYLTTGSGLMLISALITWAEHRDGRVPFFVAWMLLGMAAWGLVFMPLSGFWAILVASGLAFWSARRRSPARTR
jgi:hypothetical protein